MNTNDILHQIKNKSTKNVYLFEGEEEYSKQQTLLLLRKALIPEGMEALNYITLYNPTFSALRDAAETVSFMADSRMVVVYESPYLTASKTGDDNDFVKGCVAYLPHIPSTTCVVFYVKGKADTRKKLCKALKKEEAIVSFSVLSDQEAIRWVERSLSKKEIAVTTQVAQKLVFTVGRDMALLKQEMDKLLSYIQDRKVITTNDIDAICTKSTECTVFEMVDAQIMGKSIVTRALLKNMLRNGESPFGILSMFLRQYRILYQLRALLATNANQSGYASLLGIPPFAVRKTKEHALRYSQEKLLSVYRYLLQQEYALKSGGESQEACVENAILHISALLK